MNKFAIIVLSILISQTALFALWGSAVKSLSPLIKKGCTLSMDEIVKLSKLSDEAMGTKKVGRSLGRLNLPNDVLEDTYLRIAIHQNKLSRSEADGIMRRLNGTHGLRSTLSKIIGNSSQKTAGHLNELRIADSASKKGFKVKSIGMKYSDGIKKAPTDIDIVLHHQNVKYIVEAKDYAANTKLPIDKFRADMDTLIAYQKMHPDKKIIPIFSITKIPQDKNSLKLLQKEAERRGVELIAGTPSQQVDQMIQLGKIIK